MNAVTCRAGEAAQLARAWVELEWFKRELRGLPRLKSADLIANMRKVQPAALASASMPIEMAPEPQPSKESLKHALEPTVTAPPTPDAQVDEG